MQMEDGPFSIPGFRIGHWTERSGRTGCSVVIAERQAPGAVDVRGGAPGTRETSLLHSGRLVRAADAVLLTGGSAFGLAAADGVMNWLRDQGRGFPTRAIPVPIVPAAVIFDLDRDNPIWPDRDAGHAAAVAASPNGWLSGRFGAGAGASVAKGAGAAHSQPGGLGAAKITTAHGSIAAMFVVNAFGDVVDDETGRPLAVPASSGEGTSATTEYRVLTTAVDPPVGENTTIGVVVCDRPLSHDALQSICTAAHGGISRVIRPSHTLVDGDTVFALAPALTDVSTRLVLHLATATQLVVARAIANAIRSSMIGEPSA
jgi:L-aminopeptidase/D-esterase-like protein